MQEFKCSFLFGVFVCLSLTRLTACLPACLVLSCLFFSLHLHHCLTLAMSAPNATALPGRGRFWDGEQPTCGDLQCHGNGVCVPLGQSTVCECRLGYAGEFCRDTVNEALSLKLTLGVMAVLLGVIFAAFLFAKLRQRRKAQIRYLTEALIQHNT